jgi:hypothetical protein
VVPGQPAAPFPEPIVFPRGPQQPGVIIPLGHRLAAFL